MPEDQNDNKEWFNVAAKLGLLGCIIAIFGAVAIGIQATSVDRFEIYLVVVLLFTFVINVGLPAFYIVSMPNLKNYAVNFFRQYVFDPLIETQNTLNQMVTSFSPSNQVAPIYDMNV